MNPTVYLAGPITGKTYDDSQSWRDIAVKRFGEVGITGLSPLRSKHFLRGEGVLEGSYEHHPLSTQSGITTRDRRDCTRSDLILMNLLGADRVSIGTMIEVGWADCARNPIVLVVEGDGNVHDHPMLAECAGFVTHALDDGIDVCMSILAPLAGRSLPSSNGVRGPKAASFK